MWLLSSKGELAAAVLAGICLLAGFILGSVLEHPAGRPLVWLSLGIGLFHGARAAIGALREGLVDIDVLMVVGAVLAAWIGHPEEGALLLFLFVLAGALEDLAMQRTTREIEALHKLMPTEAVVWRNGAWADVDPQSLVAGDRLKIKPGQRVPVDCTVTLGASSIDQSAITGESVLRAVDVGDELFAGTINTDDAIEARVTKPASESSLQKVLHLVTAAREQREPVQRLIDRVSGPYAWSVMAGSALVAIVWWQLLDFPWRDAMYIAITLLIVASPCALVIATPTATLSAIARGARSGVLFKGGTAIERLANIGAVCFDKTGTLTIGRPKLEAVQPVAWSDGRQLLAIAAGLEADSTHPIAVAIRDGAASQAVSPAPLESIDHTAGRGMSGVYLGVGVRLGSYKHVESVIPTCLRNHTQEQLRLIQRDGRIGVVVAIDQQPGEHSEHAGQAAVLVLADAVRPGAPALVARLHELGVRPVRMLTGDNRLTAQRVAEELGLDRFDAELMPEDKLKAVGEMRAEAKAIAGSRTPKGVAVIGDGVNDAPALAAADVSIAIGSIGSDAALESADIVLLSDDLATVPWAVGLARAARRTVVVNLTVALSIIGAMALVTLVGSLTGLRVPLSVGVFAHEGGTVLVVANSLRLLTFRGVSRQ
jgi:Cd2+/Zn2+-exporting ATPase